MGLEAADEPISWADFERVGLMLGTVLSAAPLEGARKPAIKLEIDLGAYGIKWSSAQITDLYGPDSLVGRQVLCVTGFAPKRIAGFKSEVLVTGFVRPDGAIVLAGADERLPNGTRLA